MSHETDLHQQIVNQCSRIVFMRRKLTHVQRRIELLSAEVEHLRSLAGELAGSGVVLIQQTQPADKHHDKLPEYSSGQTYEMDGAIDASNGVFNWPCDDDDDPQNQDANYAYQMGFEKRRRQLGENFKWAT